MIMRTRLPRGHDGNPQADASDARADFLVRQVHGAGERRDLLTAECRSAQGKADVAARCGNADGPGVRDSLHDHRLRALVQESLAFGQPWQDVALDVQLGAGRVEVLGAVLVPGVGAAASDERERLATRDLIARAYAARSAYLDEAALDRIARITGPGPRVAFACTFRTAAFTRRTT